MRVFIRIAVRMVHPVEDGISTGIEERSSLRDVGTEEKEAFPKFGQLKHPVCGIAVVEKRLKKEGDVPMNN